MRQAAFFYACDHEGCDETSEPEPQWDDAALTAIGTGWLMKPRKDLCPVHAKESACQ